MSLKKLLKERKTLILKEPLIKMFSHSQNSFGEWKRFRDETIRGMYGIEEGIKPLVNAINDYFFMVTTSSCEGHPESPFEEKHYPQVTLFVWEKEKEKVKELERLNRLEDVEVKDTTPSAERLKEADIPVTSRRVRILFGKCRRDLVPLVAEKIREWKL